MAENKDAFIRYVSLSFIIHSLEIDFYDLSELCCILLVNHVKINLLKTIKNINRHYLVT